MKKFSPLAFDLLEEGNLKKSLDASLADARARLLAHIARYGTESTGKSKAKVTLEVTIAPTASSAEPDGKSFATYSITSNIKSTLPGRPSVASLAIHQADQVTGEDDLFVRASGSSEGEDPRQMKLATKDGRAIEQDTGKAVDKPAEPNKEAK